MIKVVVIEPDNAPYIKEIPPGLESMQSIVGGYIECLALNNIDRNIDLWLNEEGLLLDLPFNRYVNGHGIVGTMFVAGHDGEGNTIGLTDKQIEKVLNFFS